MREYKLFGLNDVSKVSSKLGIDFLEVEYSHVQFLTGMNVELELSKNKGGNLSVDEPVIVAEIVLLNLERDKDYYGYIEV